MQNRPTLRFPKKFLWGVATSAHQVEGGNNNQWTVWEHENAKSRAAQAEYQWGDLPNWDVIKKQAKDPANYVSGRAANHCEQYEKDFDIVKGMNMNAFRFSVEWSRVEPKEGAWNAEAIEHYKSYVAALRARGIEPMITLFHFTLPVWFAQKGGFERRSNIEYFVRFAEKILTELGKDIKYVITVNEPEVYAHESYLQGNWPPNIRSKQKMWRVLDNLAHAHNKTADMIHALGRRYKVSVAKNSVYFYAGDDSALSQKSTRIMQYAQDDYFIKKVIKRCDFLGVNYYMSARVYGYRVHNPDVKVSDLGWDLSPADIQFALERLHEKYKKPIIITENGLADANDSERQWWLVQTLVGMQKAIENGVKLDGYFHWSLLDNFEWDKGFWPRFGLLSVDYKTYKRAPKQSAIWFAKVLKRLRADNE